MEKEKGMDNRKFLHTTQLEQILKILSYTILKGINTLLVKGIITYRSNRKEMAKSDSNSQCFMYMPSNDCIVSSSVLGIDN